METLTNAVAAALSAAGDALHLGDAVMPLRALGVYAAGLALVRLGKSRLLSRASAIDVVLGVMLGSMLSRAVNGVAPVAPTLASVGALVLAHRLAAWSALRLPGPGAWLKGRGHVLIHDGEVAWDRMRAEDFSRDDLLEELRLSGGVEHPGAVRRAVLERNGRVSVVRRDAPEP